MKSKGSGTILR